MQYLLAKLQIEFLSLQQNTAANLSAFHFRVLSSFIQTIVFRIFDVLYRSFFISLQTCVVRVNFGKPSQKS